MVSPYMSNGTMSAFLESNPDADRIRLLAETASGLDYLHNLPNPVVHCDVRSANIMVDAEGKAVVIDLGSSLVLQSGVAYVPSDNGLSGNPRWMPPEALRTGGYPITPKLDAWSFASLCIDKYMRLHDHLLHTLTRRAGLLRKAAFRRYYQRWCSCD